MRLPQIMVWESDGWMARQLRELATENRWLLRPVRSARRLRQLLNASGVCGVCLLQFELWSEQREPIELLAEMHLRSPDVPIVAVSDVKLPEAERAAWTAALFDLGARYVLFPPLTKPVLEDVVSGLMLAALKRVIGDEEASEMTRRDRSPLVMEDRLTASPSQKKNEVIDLAQEEDEV
jgi:DNA-binding NtrC family response regulator